MKQVFIISMNSVFEGADSLAFNRDAMELQMKIIEIQKNKTVAGISSMEGNHSVFLA